MKQTRFTGLQAALGLLVLLLIAFPCLAQTPVDSRVSLELGSPRWDRVQGTTSYRVIITNTSETPLAAPLWLEIQNLAPPTVTLRNPSGRTPDAHPYLDISELLGPDSTLEAAGSVDVSLVFNNSTRQALSFTTRVLAIVPDFVPVPPPAPSINSYPSLTGDLLLSITGVAPQAKVVEVSAPSGTFNIPVDELGSFSAGVPLEANAKNNIVFTSLGVLDVRGGSVSIDVTHDARPPYIFIDFPGNGAEIFGSTTDVAGRVGDVLSGFEGLTVVVNGQEAEVDIGIGQNGTFFLPGVLLNEVGDTEILTVASDAQGNAATATVTVRRGQIVPGQPRLEFLSGSGQSSQIKRVLPVPLVVRALDGSGQPLAGQSVTFHITRSDGQLSPDNQGDGQLVLARETDSNGIATAYWRLGSDAGCGNNRLEVSAPGLQGTFVACASALPGPVNQINIGSGNNQQAEVNGLLPAPLQVWVNDGCNGISGFPVQFTVLQGDGLVNGDQTVTVQTGPTGHASVSLKLGPDAGTNVVEARIDGGVSPVVTFRAYGIARGDGPTMLEGIVLDNANRPLGGAVCSYLLDGIAVGESISDEKGYFSFVDIPAGKARLRVNGTTVTTAAGMAVAAGIYPGLVYEIMTIPGTRNSMPNPVLLPSLNLANARAYSTTMDTELTVEGISGLKMIVKAGSMSIHGTPAPDGTPMSLNPVHVDDIPMPLPNGANSPFAWTLQPGGAHFDPPVKIIYPNMAGLAPGAISYFLSFNHDVNQFEIVASGTVSPDGSEIVSDPGVGISISGWGGNCPPYSVTNSVRSCRDVCNAALPLVPGRVTVNKPQPNLGDIIVFTASGVVDPGGSIMTSCPDGTSSQSAVGPAPIQYRYELTLPDMTMRKGNTDYVNQLATICGKYECRFYAKVTRNCAPTEILVGTATATIPFKRLAGIRTTDLDSNGNRMVASGTRPLEIVGDQEVEFFALEGNASSPNWIMGSPEWTPQSSNLSFPPLVDQTLTLQLNAKDISIPLEKYLLPPELYSIQVEDSCASPQVAFSHVRVYPGATTNLTYTFYEMKESIFRALANLPSISRGLDGLVNYPEGIVSLELGWQELENSPEVILGFAMAAGLDPLIGLTGDVALFGWPASITHLIGAEGRIFLRLSGRVSLVGQWARDKMNSPASNYMSGSIIPSGAVMISVGVVAGIDGIARAECSATGTLVGCNGGISFDQPLTAQFNVVTGGLTLEVKVEAFNIFEFSLPWTAFPPTELYNSGPVNVKDWLATFDQSPPAVKAIGVTE